MLGVILGGRIGYVLFYGLKFWANDAWYPLKIWEGGMSFHGGLLGVIVAMTLFAWRRGRNVADVFDFTAPLPALGLFFGRIGNFINGELWGKATTVPWGFKVNGEVRHASQLYEAVLEGLVLFAIIWWFTSKPRPRLAPVRTVPAASTAWRASCVEFVRVPDEQIGYLAGGWFTDGAAAVAAHDHRRHRASLAWAYRRARALGQLRRRAMKQYLDLLRQIRTQRRTQGRPHRHRHAVGVRPADALRPRAGLPAGHHQEDPPALGGLRAAVVPARRDQRRLAARARRQHLGRVGRCARRARPGVRQAVARLARRRRPHHRPDLAGRDQLLQTTRIRAASS